MYSLFKKGFSSTQGFWGSLWKDICYEGLEKGTISHISLKPL